MTRFSISSKAVLLIGFLVLAFAMQGCSSDPPKKGLAIQEGDYAHAPGGGAANPNKH